MSELQLKLNNEEVICLSFVVKEKIISLLLEERNNTSINKDDKEELQRFEFLSSKLNQLIELCSEED